MPITFDLLSKELTIDKSKAEKICLQRIKEVTSSVKKYIFFLTQRLAELGRFKTTFTFKTAFTLDCAVGENRIVWCHVVLRVQQTYN